MNTLVVNLFGGPGVGKSTTAAHLFSLLKWANVNAEYVHEFAKDLTWEQRQKALTFTPYVVTKQMWMIHRLIGQVDVVVNDSPILLGSIYRNEGFNKHFEQHALSIHRSWWTLDILLGRDARVHPYRESGRNQSEDEAKAIDRQMHAMLARYEIPFVSIKSGPFAATEIYDNVQGDLQIGPGTTLCL